MLTYQENRKLHLKSLLLLCLGNVTDSKINISVEKAYEEMLLGLMPLGARKEIGRGRGRKMCSRAVPTEDAANPGKRLKTRVTP